MFRHWTQRVVLTLAASLLLLTYILPCYVRAAELDAKDSKLKRMLAEICKKHKVPSMSIAAVRADELITAQCNGVRKRGTEDAVTLSDRHAIGSCAKSMTSTLAAMIVEDGKIEWNTTIGEVWPNVGKKHIHPALRDVTLNDLLSHQSGLMTDLKDEANWLSFFDEKASPKKERQRMLKLLLKLKPKHPYGKHNYSNLGYVVAAAMLEKRTGESYEDMMRERLFKPLKMKSADFRTLAQAKKLKKPLLWGHMVNGTPIDPRVIGAENPSVYAPCGTVHLSIVDYAKYAQWHLAGEPAPLLKKQETLEHLHAEHVEAPAVEGAYGCGWILVQRRPGKALMHNGSNTNSYALIWIFPERDFAAIACTNTGEAGAFPACNEAIVELMKRYL